jgi:ABC-type amino acid transport system permease subunit
VVSTGNAAKPASEKMRRSDRAAAAIAILLGALLIVALAMSFWPVLDQRFHLVSDRMRQVAVDYEFRLLGLILLLFTALCGVLEVICWVGRKLNVPYLVLLLVCVGLLTAAYWWLAHALRGTLRG